MTTASNACRAVVLFKGVEPYRDGSKPLLNCQLRAGHSGDHECTDRWDCTEERDQRGGYEDSTFDRRGITVTWPQLDVSSEGAKTNG